MNDLQDLSGEGRWPCLEGQSISIIILSKTLGHFHSHFLTWVQWSLPEATGYVVITALANRMCELVHSCVF